MIILDTDVFTHLSYGDPDVKRHFENTPESEQFAVTVITRMELLKGRTDALLKAADQGELRTAAQRLQATEETLADFLVLPVDELLNVRRL